MGNRPGRVGHITTALAGMGVLCLTTASATHDGFLVVIALDVQGLPVAGATVTLKQRGRTVTHARASDADGVTRFANLPSDWPWSYEVEHPDYVIFRNTYLRLRPGERLRMIHRLSSKGEEATVHPADVNFSVDQLRHESDRERVVDMLRRWDPMLDRDPPGECFDFASFDPTGDWSWSRGDTGYQVTIETVSPREYRVVTRMTSCITGWTMTRSARREGPALLLDGPLLGSGRAFGRVYLVRRGEKSYLLPGSAIPWARIARIESGCGAFDALPLEELRTGGFRPSHILLSRTADLAAALERARGSAGTRRAP